MSTQISSLLIKELKDGEFSTVERLPSEVELAERLGVSRTVIRDALSDLEREGLIERVRGIGTVINRQIVQLVNRMDLKLEYNELILSSGYRPSTDSVQLRLEAADAQTADMLSLDEGEELIVCEKRVLAGNIPVIYSYDYFARSLFDLPDFRQIDWSASIFDILDRYCGITVLSSLTRVRALLGPNDVRERLQVEDGQALIMLDELGCSKLGRPILRSYGFYTDFFDFTILRKKF